VHTTAVVLQGVPSRRVGALYRNGVLYGLEFVFRTKLKLDRISI
jgi:hypothetical protein